MLGYGDRAVLKTLAHAPFGQKKVVAVFDGFLDEIKAVVREWSPDGAPVFYQSRAEWLEDLRDDGRNRDFDLCTTHKKAGGSAALAAGACAQMGVQTAAWIAAGEEAPLPEFQCGAALHTLGEPPITWAIEFATGKLMLADREPLRAISWEKIRNHADFPQLKEAVARCDVLLVMGYAVLHQGRALYEGLLQDVLKPLTKRPAVLLDLADISQKPREELETLVTLLRNYGAYCDTTVFFNRNEAEALLRADRGAKLSPPVMAKKLGGQLAPCGVVVHTAEQSALWANGIAALALHPPAEDVQVKTGCGDHFCAGFGLGRLAGLQGAQLLRAAGLVARSYMETGKSPAQRDMTDLLHQPMEAEKTLQMAAMDFDGTALEPNQQFSARTKDVLRRLSERGVLLCACTGRSFQDVLRLIADVPYFSYAVTSNGGDIHALGEFRRLAGITMTDEAAAHTLAVLKKRNVYFEAYLDGRAWCERRSLEQLAQKGKLEEYFAGGGDLVGRTEDMRSILKENPGRLTKFFVMLDEPAEALELRDALHSVAGIFCTSSGPCNLEILAPGVDKAIALQIVSEDSGVPRESILAVGDGENDMGMLRWCGCGVAMGNAPQEVRRAADYVCPSVTQGGMADALEYFFLTENCAADA